MSRHGDAIRQGFEELGGSATLNELSFQTCLRLTTIRDHLNLHSTQDENGLWCDAFSWCEVMRDGQKVVVYSLTGLEPL